MSGWDLLNVVPEKMNEPSLHTLSGYGVVFGILGLTIAVILWRISEGGGNGVGGIVLPRFLGGAIIFTMVATVLWWSTRP